MASEQKPSGSGADRMFLGLVTPSERLVRRTPASRSRLADELHEVVGDPVVLAGAASGRARVVTCPTCAVTSEAPSRPGVMTECPCCGDGFILSAE